MRTTAPHFVVLVTALGTACGGTPSAAPATVVGVGPVASSSPAPSSSTPAPPPAASATAAPAPLAPPSAPGVFREGCVKTGALAFDETHVLWATESATRTGDADPNAVWAAPRAGGEPRRLMTLRGAASLAVDDTFVFVAQEFDSWPKAGGPHYISWIAKVPKAGGDPVMLFTKRTNPGKLHVDGTRLYWSEGKSIRSARKDGTDEIAIHPRGTGSLIGDEDAIYVSDFAGSPASAQVVRIAKASKGVGAKTVIASGIPEVQALAMDATHVYAFAWTNAAPNAGMLVRAPKQGGAMQTIAKGLTYVSTIAVDDTRVYLGGDKGVLTIPKVPAKPLATPAAWTTSGAVVSLAITHGAVMWTGAFLPAAPACADPAFYGSSTDTGVLGWAASAPTAGGTP